MVDSKEDECSFNKNGGCLFYDVIQSDINQCLRLMIGISHKNSNQILVEMERILKGMKERAGMIMEDIGARNEKAEIG